MDQHRTKAFPWIVSPSIGRTLFRYSITTLVATFALIALADSCSAQFRRHRPGNGQCGSDNGGSFSTAPPSSGLCSMGNATLVSGGGGSPWTWMCDGRNGGGNASCSAMFVAAPVNGACGPANGVPTKNAPSSGVCLAGNATPVTGSGPWSWSCAGTNGGTTASCSAPFSRAAAGVAVVAQFKPLAQAKLYSMRLTIKCTNELLRREWLATIAITVARSPWATLQHADSANVGAGACINVAPGTYNGLTVTHGGDAATSTGYVVYRCQTLDGCTVNGNAGVNGTAAFETVQLLTERRRIISRLMVSNWWGRAAPTPIR